MPFAYYARLSRREQAIYRQSAAIAAIRLPPPAAAASQPVVAALRSALAADDRGRVELAAARIAAVISDALGAETPSVEVLAVRPRFTGGELHGLYVAVPGEAPRISLWMRTAAHRRVVAFRTFLRTLLHEVCHHLDLSVLDLTWSFHTEGFFKRESSLFHQLVPEARVSRGGLLRTRSPSVS